MSPTVTLTHGGFSASFKAWALDPETHQSFEAQGGLSGHEGTQLTLEATAAWVSWSGQICAWASSEGQPRRLQTACSGAHGPSMIFSEQFCLASALWSG